MSRVRVAVIGGGQNSEHDVSLASAASVRAALNPVSYEAVAFTIERDGRWLDDTGAPFGPTPAQSLAGALGVIETCAVVLPVLHGPLGEDGALAALCALAGVPCVGSPLRAGALAMDKWATKLVAEAVGLRTATGTLVTRATADWLRFDRPVVVKPVAAGSSHGVSLVRSEPELAPAVEAALLLDDRVLVEDLISGREIDIAVLARSDGSRLVGPPLEIVMDPGGIFDTGTKYDGSANFALPASVDPAVGKELEDAALVMFDALGCDGVARVDFFLTAEGLVLNEVNTMPGLTAQSQVPKMFATVGLPYSELLDELVRATLGQTDS